MNRALFALLAATLLLACNVASVDQAPSITAQNRCSGNSDCTPGDCDNKQCRSHSGTLPSVLFEVTPPAEATAGLQFLKRVELAPGGGDMLPLDLDLVTQSIGEVKVVERTCVPEFDFAMSKDGSIPAVLTLTPTTTLLGLYSPRSVVASELIGDKNFGFSLFVPPGRYDIYVEPRHQPNGDCPVPPALLRGQTISGPLQIKLPGPSTFEFHVTWPRADDGLNGWLADMLDPLSGRVLSTRALLTPSADKTDYSATLYYLPVVSNTAEPAAQELVRLSPPEGSVAPTILLARSALGLVKANRGVLSQFSALPAPVHVQGQVTALGQSKPVAAVVTLVATKISSLDPGVLASFVRTTNVGPDGNLELDLLPGTYRVSAVPATELSSGLASDAERSAVSLEWTVPSSPSTQAGRLIELGPASPVLGVATMGTVPLATAQVSAVTSPRSVQSDVLHQALGETLFVPRASTGSVDVGGAFSLRADSGTFNISVRPLPSTGFGWLVLPNVPVGTAPAGTDLGKLIAPPPVSYRGTVTGPVGRTSLRTRVSGALIRAYVYMKGDSYTTDDASADSVLQVAETRSDDSGNFEVLIPAALNRWDATPIE